VIKYIISVLWRAAKHLSYIEEARCLKVKSERQNFTPFWQEANKQDVGTLNKDKVDSKLN